MVIYTENKMCVLYYCFQHNCIIHPATYFHYGQLLDFILGLPFAPINKGLIAIKILKQCR